MRRSTTRATLSARLPLTLRILCGWQRASTGWSKTASTAERSVLAPSRTHRIGRVTSKPRSRRPTNSSVTKVAFSVSPSTTAKGCSGAVDVDAEGDYTAVTCEMDPSTSRRRDRDPTVTPHQLGQRRLGCGHEAPRDRRARGPSTARGHGRSDGFEGGGWTPWPAFAPWPFDRAPRSRRPVRLGLTADETT
jgi:hypothetical protein